MLGRLEDGSWFTWMMHQFTLAKHTLVHDSLYTYRVCSWTRCMLCYGLEDGTCQWLLD